MPDSPTPNSPSAPETEPADPVGGRSPIVRAIRAILWLACAASAIFSVYIGSSSVALWNDLDRWATEPSVSASLDLDDTTGVVTVTWVQDCGMVCHQGLWVRAAPGSGVESLAALSGSMSMGSSGDDDEREEHWLIGPDETPDADGSTALFPSGRLRTGQRNSASRSINRYRKVSPGHSSFSSGPRCAGLSR